MDREAARRKIVALVRAIAPWTPDALTEDTLLGRDGLGFDSVSVVELLVACEDGFGVPFPSEIVTEKLTIGALVEHVERGRAR